MNLSKDFDILSLNKRLRKAAPFFGDKRDLDFANYPKIIIVAFVIIGHVFVVSESVRSDPPLSKSNASARR